MKYSTYIAHHNWVKRWKGKPLKCEKCGESDRKLHWANKSHNYIRIKSDWISLCVPCHREYDGHTKFTKDGAAEIRKEYETGLISQQRLADKYGVSRCAIVNAIKGQIKTYA